MGTGEGTGAGVYFGQPGLTHPAETRAHCRTVPRRVWGRAGGGAGVFVYHLSLAESHRGPSSLLWSETCREGRLLAFSGARSQRIQLSQRLRGLPGGGDIFLAEARATCSVLCARDLTPCSLPTPPPRSAELLLAAVPSAESRGWGWRPCPPPSCPQNRCPLSQTCPGPHTAGAA